MGCQEFPIESLKTDCMLRSLYDAHTLIRPTWFLPWFCECCTEHRMHGAICVHIKCFVCVSISIFSVNNGRNNRSAHFVLCFFCCILGLLDSCIILLHFTEFTDLYFIRYGFFCLHSPAFFSCRCVRVCMSGLPFILRSFFGRFLFFIAFHIRIHELFFASFGYKQFFLRSSQSCNVKTEHEKMKKSQKKLEKRTKTYTVWNEKRIIFALKNCCTKNWIEWNNKEARNYGSCMHTHNTLGTVYTNRNTVENGAKKKKNVNSDNKGNQCTHCVEKRLKNYTQVEWLRKCETMKKNGGKTTWLLHI